MLAGGKWLHEHRGAMTENLIDESKQTSGRYSSSAHGASAPRVVVLNDWPPAKWFRA